MSGSLRLNDALEITYNRLYIVIFTIIVFSLIMLVLKRTRLGLDIRAVSQNRTMAKAMGIPTEWVGCDDVWARFGYLAACGGRGAQPVDQCRSESNSVLYHRFVHGGRIWRRRKPLGIAHRRDGRWGPLMSCLSLSPEPSWQRFLSSLR